MNLTPPPVEESITEASENIVPMNEEATESLEIIMSDVEKDKYCANHHGRVKVEKHRRLLICQDCGKAIDPFDYVLEWAQKGDRKMKALKFVEAKSRIAHRQFEHLETRIKNLRAQLKRMGHEQPKVEIMDYRHDLLNADHPSIRLA